MQLVAISKGLLKNLGFFHAESRAKKCLIWTATYCKKNYRFFSEFLKCFQVLIKKSNSTII